jgi:catechol 2,3-dioxygenase-like lactoylglutathione lyase family enzyme
MVEVGRAICGPPRLTAALQTGWRVRGASGELGKMRLLINIDVDDLDAGVRFYTSALGLTVARRFGEAGVELLGAQAPIYLLKKPPGTDPFEGAAPGARDYGRHWTPVHLDVVVDDVDAAVAQAEAAGARVEGRSDASWGRLALLADPFGHGFCLLEFRGRGYDEIATG